jgi:nucleotidyltransferase substrate binding protein (TIGR01987 family)
MKNLKNNGSIGLIVSVELLFGKTEKVLTALRIALNDPLDSKGIIRDATFRRFSFAVNFSLDLLKECLAQKGLEVYFPKDITKNSAALLLIADQSMWDAMIDDKNTAPENYDEELAMEIYGRIKTYYPLFKTTLDILKKEHYKGSQIQVRSATLEDIRKE